jgi:hypothetical protein
MLPCYPSTPLVREVQSNKRVQKSIRPVRLKLMTGNKY